MIRLISVMAIVAALIVGVVYSQVASNEPIKTDWHVYYLAALEEVEAARVQSLPSFERPELEGGVAEAILVALAQLRPDRGLPTGIAQGATLRLLRQRCLEKATAKRPIGP